MVTCTIPSALTDLHVHVCKIYINIIPQNTSVQFPSTIMPAFDRADLGDKHVYSLENNNSTHYYYIYIHEEEREVND